MVGAGNGPSTNAMAPAAAGRAAGFTGMAAFAPLHHMDQKNFLRLHIGAGALTIYPVGIDRRLPAVEARPRRHRPFAVAGPRGI